ncbi:MAG: signal peptidase II [Candidatus Moranbacteria bacterium]|nr:signal peptidase II [Candidatus Moranbacteria bacterium]
MRNKLIVVASVIFLDQVLKYLSQQELLPQTEGVFGFLSICNPLLSWGIPLEGLFFWMGWFLAFVGLIILIFKFAYNWPLFLTLGGALSNFIDRVRLECVVDYFKIGSFPIFNLADVFIMLGVVIFIYKLGKMGNGR